MRTQMDRYEEYPKMRELIQRKDDLVAQKATPPYYLNVSTLVLTALDHCHAELCKQCR